MSTQVPSEPGLASRSQEPRLHPDMVSLSGGTFRMGSDQHYTEEAPAHHATVSPFWMDRTPVTNRQCREIVESIDYITITERVPDATAYPGSLPHMLKPGSLVFSPPRGPVDLNDWSQWWRFEFGANWRRPRGRGHFNRGLDDHPVVHVALEDALSYATWAGKSLPTEAEWEFAARGGLDGAEFAWGAELMPDGRHMANIWQGRFPFENLAADGYSRTSPVGVFPPNGYGLHDMIGNVWEWTTDWFSSRHIEDASSPCCIPMDPRGGCESDSYEACNSSVRIPRKVVKGGSHLCASNYCRRYRPAARHAQPIDTGMSHIGFRCIVRQSDVA